MVSVVNDLHGNKGLVQRTVDTIKTMTRHDTLIVNGDGAGARGPVMNNLVRIFYEVRRGETDYSCLMSALTDIIGEEPEFPKSWFFDSVHAGMFRAIMSKHFDAFRSCVESELLDTIEETIRPLADAANAVGLKIYYVPGNGEVVPSDFATDDITTEVALPPEQRFYQKLHREGYFESLGITYVPYVHAIELPQGRVLLLGVNLLDLPTEEALGHISECCPLDGEKPARVLVHYPPAISPIGKTFSFWTPNKTDVARSDNLKAILEALQLEKATVFFGHVHLPVTDQRMDLYPPTIEFFNDREDYSAIWVKPGVVTEIL